MTSIEIPDNNTVAVKKAQDSDFQQNAITIIDQLDLQPLQKQFIKGRWLRQVIDLERLWRRYRWRYNIARITTIVGGVIVPALISLNINGNEMAAIFGWLTFGLSQIVAICAALEEFFHYGELYRQYRNSAELMKMEAWYFLQLSGPYLKFPKHQLAFKTFAGRVEKIIEQDLQILIQIGQEQEKQEEQLMDLGKENDILSVPSPKIDK